MYEVCTLLKHKNVAEINTLLELFEEKLEICKIHTIPKPKKLSIDRISISKISWMQFLEKIILKLQIYALKCENKKPGSKTKRKKKQQFEKMRHKSKNPFKYPVILVNLDFSFINLL